MYRSANCICAGRGTRLDVEGDQHFLLLEGRITVRARAFELACLEVPHLQRIGSKRGMKRRLELMLQGEPAPENLIIARDWPAIDKGGVELIKKTLEKHKDIRLVVIDTLKRIRGRGDARRNAYDEDYEALRPIAEIAEEITVSFLVIHHTNKRAGTDVLDQVSGSTGLTGAVDNVIVLSKERGQLDAKLTVVPREEEELELALTFDGALATWILQGSAQEFAKTRARQQVLLST